jgi:hypothetical protein
MSAATISAVCAVPFVMSPRAVSTIAAGAAPPASSVHVTAGAMPRCSASAAAWMR